MSFFAVPDIGGVDKPKVAAIKPQLPMKPPTAKPTTKPQADTSSSNNQPKVSVKAKAAMFEKR